jgi:hypothetical protein
VNDYGINAWIPASSRKNVYDAGHMGVTSPPSVVLRTRVILSYLYAMSLSVAVLSAHQQITSLPFLSYNQLYF